MSIFRDTFPDFVSASLLERQTGMATRDPAFLHQLNSRTAWTRMTSGVNYQGTNNLAEKYVLQGGVLNNSSLRYGLGGNGTSAYDTKSPGGTPHRMGIRPMPGITGVEIQSRGAYGSLQEATVSFTCWDIKQLEELEILYMRPGYTVLLEFGWSYVNPIPKYDILNKPPTSLNEAFDSISKLVEKHKGNYEALIGYVKNYNWSARDDGGYDCTTTIISLGEVLESLKCNWVPMDTTAFSGDGILGYAKKDPQTFDSYQQGIIPGLLHELWNFLREQGENTSNPNFAPNFYDRKTGSTYFLCMSEAMEQASKNDRAGFSKYLGKDTGNVEGWITLGSFCELINNYVLLKDQNNDAIAQILPYETDLQGNIIKEKVNGVNVPKSLACIASPFSLSTNPGVCWVRNDNWAKLGISTTPSEEETTTASKIPTKTIAPDIQALINSPKTKLKETSGGGVAVIPADGYYSLSNRFVFKIKKLTTYNFRTNTYQYNGDLKQDLTTLANELVNALGDAKIENNKIIYTFTTGQSFESPISNNITINLLNYLGDVNNIYDGLFYYNYDSTTPNSGVGFREDPFTSNGTKDNTGFSWNHDSVISLITNIFSKVSIDINPELVNKQKKLLEQVAQNVSQAAADTSLLNSGLQYFLIPSDSELKKKTLGRIANIYVNINYLYTQAVSRNLAAGDTQNKNNISIREYLQTVLREIQNSMGNINDFDIQVDNRNAIGRIIDINFTGEPSNKVFTLQIHNTNSVVRNYSFQSKIFPDMGAIIAISAQDATGVGKLGYDNATLVAWNENITDRIITKKSFNNSIALSDQNDPNTYLYPFLTQLVNYFNAIQGKPGTNQDNSNYAYSGLNFAYRDFLSHMSYFDGRNDYKTIIPTALSITLDGIGGIVIGNIFKINEDIIPKSYRGTKDRNLAYIVTKINHTIQDNDWVTELGAYPIIYDYKSGTNVANKWNNQTYPGSVSLTLGGKPILNFISVSDSIQNIYIPARDKALSGKPNGLKILLTAQSQLEGFKPGNANFDLNNPGNFRNQVGNAKPVAFGQRGGFVQFASLEDGIKTQEAQINLIISGKSRSYPKDATLEQYINIYAPSSDNNNPSVYVNYIISYFKKFGYTITKDTRLSQIVALK